MSKSYSGLFDTPVSLTPTDIRYSQNSVNGSKEIIDSMDNTRLVAATEVGIDVKAVVHKYDDPLSPAEKDRFTTKKGVPSTWGEAVKLRIQKQASSWRKTHPYGAYHMDKSKVK